MTATRILRVERNVADLDSATAFYRDALGFTAGSVERVVVDGQPARAMTLSLGRQDIRLTRFDRPGRSYPRDGNAGDLCFQHCAIVAGDMAAAHARLTAYGCTPISPNGPVRLPPEAGGVTAFKFRDPDGHPLELIHFPHGPRWRQAGLTLGIDHTAISVGDAEVSIAFYQNLGFTLAARQVNHGPAQDQLDALRDVSVAVVALEPALETPHLELLAYRAPRGRSGAADLADLAADRLVLASAACFEPALLRDPDGHIVALVPDDTGRPDCPRQ